MFQYSFGRFLSIYTQTELYLNIGLYDKNIGNRDYDLDIFELSGIKLITEEESTELIEIAGVPLFIIEERFFHFDVLLMEKLKAYFGGKNKPRVTIFISGYWQSPKYFNTISSILRTDFTFKNRLYGNCKSMYEEICKCNSVMINVRRGDFLDKIDYHGVVNVNYISSAIDLINSRVFNPKFFVFSDDIQWCIDHLLNYNNIVFVGEEYYDSKYQYYLQMMVACKHFILSNSSFAWWAAWLAEDVSKLVVAPKNWFATDELDTKDLLPNNWITIV